MRSGNSTKFFMNSKVSRIQKEECIAHIIKRMGTRFIVIKLDSELLQRYEIKFQTAMFFTGTSKYFVSGFGFAVCKVEQ